MVSWFSTDKSLPFTLLLICLAREPDGPSPRLSRYLFRVAPRLLPSSPVTRPSSGSRICRGHPSDIAEDSAFLKSSSVPEQWKITFSVTAETNRALSGSAANLDKTPFNRVQYDISTDFSLAAASRGFQMPPQHPGWPLECSEHPGSRLPAGTRPESLRYPSKHSSPRNLDSDISKKCEKAAARGGAV